MFAIASEAASPPTTNFRPNREPPAASYQLMADAETKEHDDARRNLYVATGGPEPREPAQWVDHDGERHSLRPYRVAPTLILDRFSRQVALVRWI